jgi:hypothetical protein
MTLVVLLVVTGGPAAAAFTGHTTNSTSTFTAAVLAAPTSLTATQNCTAGSITAALGWTPTASTWADGYAWTRTTGGVTSSPAAVSGQPTATATDSTSLTAATTYQYALRATAGAWRSTAATAALTTTSCGGVTVADITSGNTSAAAYTIGIPRPASTASGDLLIAMVADAGTVAVTPDQAGWTAIRTDQSHNEWMTQALWYRWAGASEPANYTFTKPNPKADMIGAIVRITGANVTSPIDAHAGNGQGGTVSTAITAPSVTTTVANTLLLTFASTTGANTYTPAAGMTERLDFTIGKWASEQVASEAIAATGATGQRSITISDVGNVYAVAQSIAIRP